MEVKNADVLSFPDPLFITSYPCPDSTVLQHLKKSITLIFLIISFPLKYKSRFHLKNLTINEILYSRYKFYFYPFSKNSCFFENSMYYLMH